MTHWLATQIMEHRWLMGIVTFAVIFGSGFLFGRSSGIRIIPGVALLIVAVALLDGWQLVAKIADTMLAEWAQSIDPGME